jgi:hypothetical protein
MTGLGSFAQKWQHCYENWLWKTMNGSGNLKKSIIFQWVISTFLPGIGGRALA